MNRRLYAIHRWLSALAFVQLAVWTLSGLFFATVPLQRVRGNPVRGAHAVPIPNDVKMLAPTEAIECAVRYGLDRPSTLELRATPAGLFYIARSKEAVIRLDASSGAEARVSQGEAEEAARRDQPNRTGVAAATLIAAEPSFEYRQKPLPAWRVALADDAGTVVYVDAMTGDVTARRNDLWRWYDWLWALHIMDYQNRESFNHPLLIGAAALAVSTIASGVVLWIVRLARWLRRGGAPGSDATGAGGRTDGSRTE